MGMQRTAQEISVGRFLRILFCFSMFSLLHKTAAAWTTLRMSTVQKHSMHRAVFSLIESRQQKLSYQLPYRQRNSCRRSVMSTVVCYHGEISSDTEAASSMENLYQEWTLEQDELLWRNRLETIPKIASMLGRGLRGTQQRLEKLTNVDSAAYQRLFTNDRNRDSEKDTEVIPKKAFVPSSQVLRRIQWDTQLSPKDFSLLHYDRVDDAVVETALDAPNTSIAGKSTSFVDALPEHRIVGIKYRERVVWDREARTESFFANGGIETVMAKYDEWKRNEDEKKELTRRRQAHVTNRVRSVLGEERFISLKECSNEMATALRTNPSLSMKLETEKYVRSALELFVQARVDSSSANKKVEKMPANDSEAIDALSELVAIFPDENLRSLILVELSISMRKATGAKIGRKAYHRELPHILESDLTETFVRGSGSGGQKVNKTSSRVFLVHEPTKLSVECQDTRSLQQNRKIARKRLREKLDNYLHGNQSKENIKNQIKSSKKQKQKARSRARQKRRQASKEEDSS